MLTPLDLNSKTFSKGFRGYDIEDVNEFFGQVSKDYERLYQDNVELKDTVERVSAKLEYYQHMEGTMQSTLSVAQETADEMKKSSKQKVELLEKKNQTECEQKKADADAYVAKVKADAETYAAKIREEADAHAEKSKAEAQAFIDKMRGMAEIEVAKLKVDSDDQSKKILADAKQKADSMMTDASSRSRKLLDDAANEARNKMFTAEQKAAVAMSTYEDQMKKAAMHRNTVISFLETQLESFKNFNNGSDTAAKTETPAAAVRAETRRMSANESNRKAPMRQILVTRSTDTNVEKPAVPAKPLAHPKNSLPDWMK